MSSGSGGGKPSCEVSTDGLSDDDERAAQTALAPNQFSEKGVKHTKCDNFLICSGYAKEPHTLCGAYWQSYTRILFLSEKGDDITCYVCGESGKQCVKYTCSPRHGVCMSCFIQNRLNTKGYNNLRSCTLCRIHREEQTRRALCHQTRATRRHSDHGATSSNTRSHFYQRE
jgi:hypothetical protein